MNDLIFKIKTLYYAYVLKKDTLPLRIDYCRSKGVRIGENVRAHSMPIAAEPYLLNIGDNVMISREVSFITHDMSVSRIFEKTNYLIGDITIGNNCFIGYRSLILPGVKLGENTIVAAGSVVTKSFKDGNVVIGGNPAKIICTIESFKQRSKTNCFDFKDMSFNEKKQNIFENTEKWISK
ncbi:MAG: acyltransferase [Culicoidibacterales bacterium]